MRTNLLLLLPQKKEQDLLLNRFQGEYNIYIAPNPAEVMAIVESVSIQLIVCSVEMPAVDGWELCRTLKSAVLFSHIPVILLTADDSLQSKIKNLESGADAYVSRPFSLTYLEALIKNLLANRAKITAHFTGSQQEPAITADVESEETFIKKLHDHICDNVHNCSLNVEQLARLMNMSRPVFYKKIKRITNLTPNDLINRARLMHAARLLESADYKVNEIARMTGFHSQSSFAKSFVKRFKVTPTEYRRLKMKTRLQKRATIQRKYIHNIGTVV
jgi:AraC-like DNA-binding protein/CheY-like chemotaxis protein